MSPGVRPRRAATPGVDGTDGSPLVSHVAGTRAITATADPDLGTLTDALRTELDVIIHAESTSVTLRRGSHPRKPLQGQRRKPGRLALAVFWMPLRAYCHEPSWAWPAVTR